MVAFGPKTLRKFGDFWRESRCCSGFSQQEVAKLLGYKSSQFVSNWERGLCSIPLKVQKRLLKIYKIPPEQWIKLYMEELEKELRSALR